MKKTFLSGLLLFVAAATLSGCSKDETTDPATTAQTTISATVEEPTRTALDGAFVKWVAGDKILLANTGTATAEYTLKTIEGGGTSGTFTGENLGTGEKFALYPYNAAATCAGGKFSFEMPATQENGNLTFGNGANPMIAKSDDKKVLNFKNVCGAIRLRLKGTQKVGKIVVTTATTEEKLSGKAIVELVNTSPVLRLDASAANTVTLNCNNTQLNTTTATSFYVVVPAATYTTGLQFEIYDEMGAVISSLPTTQALTINRSKVAKMPEKTVTKINFPDPAFRTALVRIYSLKLTDDQTDIDVNYNSNQAKFSSTTRLDINSSNITSLKGIEYFTALTTLNVFNNGLTSLDVNKNTALTNLQCYNNKLTSLDVCKNTALKVLDCDSNLLPSLNLSENTALTELHCKNNLLPSLDVIKNTALTYIDCAYNKLTILNLSENKALTHLYCFDNPLKSLNLINNTALTHLYCFSNPLKSLNLINNTALTHLDCGDNQLTELDVNKNTALKTLYCIGNPLTSLNLIKNTALTVLNCSNNKLTSLDISQNTALTDLRCYLNKLPSLDIRSLTSLTMLQCGKQMGEGYVAPFWTYLHLDMTKAQYDAGLGTGTGTNNDFVIPSPPSTLNL